VQNEPAATLVFDSVAGRLTFITPEVVGGTPVLMIVEPNVDVGAGALRVPILLNAYDKDAGAPPFARWMREGLLRYVNQGNSRRFWRRLGSDCPVSRSKSSRERSKF